MSENLKEEIKPTKITNLARAADGLSVGISIVVAIVIGFLIGWGLKSLSGSNLGLGIGIFIGVAAAINNVYKAYKSQLKTYEDLKEKDELLKSVKNTSD